MRAMIKKILVAVLLFSLPVYAFAQLGVGIGAAVDSFNQSSARQSQNDAAMAQVLVQAEAIKQMRLDNRERFGTGEIKKLNQQENQADAKLAMIIGKLYGKQ